MQVYLQVHMLHVFGCHCIHLAIFSQVVLNNSYFHPGCLTSVYFVSKMNMRRAGCIEDEGGAN